MSRSGYRFQAIEGATVAANVGYYVLGDVGRIEQSELPGRQDLEAGASVTRQHTFPCGRRPFFPLLLGQSHGDGAGLDGDEPSSLLSDASVDKLSDCREQVVGAEVAPQFRDLTELAVSRGIYLNQTEHC